MVFFFFLVIMILSYADGITTWKCTTPLPPTWRGSEISNGLVASENRKNDGTPTLLVRVYVIRVGGDGWVGGGLPCRASARVPHILMRIRPNTYTCVLRTMCTFIRIYIQIIL